MPGAVSNTSTRALTNVTLPYAVEIADKGYEKAAKENPEIAKGINILKGKVTYKAVADVFGLAYYPVETLL
jgi:alanine dehydrogenase